MKTCFETTRGFAWPIKLQQHANKTFRVVYGKQVDDNLNYADAAAKLGEAFMHAVACEGNLDNEEPWYEQDKELLSARTAR